MSDKPSITRVVKFIKKGERGGSVIVADTSSRHYTYAQWQTYGATGHLETWGSINNADKFRVGDTIVINGVCSDRGNIGVSLYATVGAVNVENKSVTAATTSLIMSGENGISIVVTGENVVFTKINQVLNVYVEVFKGGQRLKYGTSKDGFFCSTLSSGHYLLDNNVYWGFTTDDGGYRFCYRLLLLNKVEVNGEVPFTITAIGLPYSRTLRISTVFDGEKGERGPALRGPQDWEKLPVGYSFQAGKDGDEWKDVVVYKGNYASCIKGHTKTSTNYPDSTDDSNNGYWSVTNKWEIVATNILLTSYALIKNLGVEVIDMKDSDGNILFQAKDGKVVCKTGTFENVSVNGIIHSSLTYSSVKRIVNLSSYTIDPQKEAFNTLFVSTGSTCRVYLPDANAYEGLELNIYQNVVSTMELGSVIMSTYNQSQRIYCSNGTALINGTVVMTINSLPMGDNNFKIIPNILTRLLAVNGNWYVLSGALTGE